MNDEELPINDELASAYLDAELDPTERAAVSADPEVMATVESFARVRSALGEIEPVVGSAKDDALAAALAEFDARHIAATAAAPVAKVTSLQSRRRAYRALTSVAAAVAILAIGVAAISSTRGGDNKSSSEVAPAGTIAPSAADAPSLKVSAQTETAAAATAAPSAAGTIAAPTAADNASAGAATAGPPPVDTRDALIQYAARIEGVAAPAPQTPTTTVPADSSYESIPVGCLTSHQVVLGGPITVDGTLAYAVRDQDNGTLQAIDAANCTVLLEVPGP
jgi:negative regulator of sigma E activity